ncbi:MAG TPA: hypothetical protein RMG45_01285, partial [Polyangiaceae bacterium LLY-WYZ-15_(1-7)]|nr:hypothetical protein [Polyangiaceae bacterium LLY-WYZ-15_(1-7)]
EAARAEAPRPSRMARRRPARRPASARGHVNVVTPGGWADVYHRGRHLGRTPRQIELPAGRRIIELRPFGRSRGIRVSVHVPSGDVTRVVRPVER